MARREMARREMAYRSFVFVSSLLLLATIGGSVGADPCGMVPPIHWVSNERPIQRIGIQKTYVFFKDGVETIVLRPAFSGKIDEFGMLIPFPTPPTVRKVPADVFDHIAAAIDPPEVVLDMRPVRGVGGGMGGGMGGGGGIGGGGMGGGVGGGGFTYGLSTDTVRVIRREAVGMYEVAVLQAGSASALKRWMTLHSFRYPNGMERVCSEYIAQRWCFAAVKTKVKSKPASDPQPGQREVKNNLPLGAKFDGHVQAMGFRFRVRTPVVPMRLSVFNSNRLRNVVYLLATDSAKIDQLAPGYVVRQVPGKTLLRNLTRPLPLRVIGRLTRASAQLRRRVKRDRDPRPHNGIAAELFSTDLAAARTGNLLQRHETVEKQYVQIGEGLNLRGDAYDAVMNRLLQKTRFRVARSALRALESMTLTVIDGNFPRETLARHNLTFRRFKMDPKRSTPALYDAKKFGPTPQKPGVLYLGALSVEQPKVLLAQVKSRRSSSMRAGTWPGLLLMVAGAGSLGLLLVRRKGKLAAVTTIGLTIAVICVACSAPHALARKPAEPKKTPSMSSLFRQLDDPIQAAWAIDEIVKSPRKSKTVRALLYHARSRRLTKRGWAMVGLGRIGGKRAVDYLRRTYRNAREPGIVRLWAAAALAKATQEALHIRELTDFAQQNPALTRPLVLELHGRIQKNPDDVDLLQGFLTVAEKSPATVEQVLATGPATLVALMTTANSGNIRRKAAAFLATLGNRPGKYRQVAGTIVDKIAFRSGRSGAPWGNHALFIPGIPWTKNDARLVVRNLVAWYVWADRNKKPIVQRQILNTLNGANSICRQASFEVPDSGGTFAWLRELRQALGKKKLNLLLSEQGLVDRYQGLLQ